MIKLGALMIFFFVRDYKNRYRYLSSEPLSEIQVRFSRWRKIWEAAKKKLTLLPQRILYQEQAFRKSNNLEGKRIKIIHSGRLEERKIKTRFRFFLRTQKTKHILFLIGETLLLPLSGLAVFLPGPNVFFGVLALLMITHWQALRGINKLLKKEYDFTPSSLFDRWEEVLEFKEEQNFLRTLKEIEKEYRLVNLHQILWK
jgi:hypothetical protein